MAWSDVLAGALRLFNSGLTYLTRSPEDKRKENRLKNEKYAEAQIEQLKQAARDRRIKIIKIDEEK